MTIGHEPGAECDACAQPAPVLVENEDGAALCDVCRGEMSSTQFWRAAMINGIYSWGDGW